MIERRDPVRGSPAESPPAAPTGAGARRFARLVAATPLRRLAVGRLVAVLVLAGAAVGLLVVGSAGAVHSALEWLRGQPPYLLDFARIELDPPPPPWVRSGAPGLLERVRGRAGFPKTVRILDLNLERLARAFPLGSPWVKSVTRVERSGRNRLRVQLAYRAPVAFVRLGPPARRDTLYLDADAVVLPADDLNMVAAGPLIELANLDPQGARGVAAETRPGLALRLTEPGDPGHEATEERVRDAARLAGFLHRHEAARTPLQVRAILAASVGFYLQTADPAFIYWGLAPGSEPPGAPSAEQKWTWLRQWLDQHTLGEVVAPQILALDRDRWVLRKARQRQP